MLLKDMGLEEERLRLEWISASEGNKFREVVNDMVIKIKEIGPSPLRSEESK
jgi:F420-non-reducing hydrogenase iron-sulfur subunit